MKLMLPNPHSKKGNQLKQTPNLKDSTLHTTKLDVQNASINYLTCSRLQAGVFAITFQPHHQSAPVGMMHPGNPHDWNLSFPH